MCKGNFSVFLYAVLAYLWTTQTHQARSSVPHIIATSHTLAHIIMTFKTLPHDIQKYTTNTPHITTSQSRFPHIPHTTTHEPAGEANTPPTELCQSLYDPSMPWASWLLHGPVIFSHDSMALCYVHFTTSNNLPITLTTGTAYGLTHS